MHVRSAGTTEKQVVKNKLPELDDIIAEAKKTQVTIESNVENISADSEVKTAIENCPGTLKLKGEIAELKSEIATLQVQLRLASYKARSKVPSTPNDTSIDPIEFTPNIFADVKKKDEALLAKLRLESESDKADTVIISSTPIPTFNAAEGVITLDMSEKDLVNFKEAEVLADLGTESQVDVKEARKTAMTSTSAPDYQDP